MDTNVSTTPASWAEFASLKLSSSLPASNPSLYWLALLVLASVIAAPLRHKFQDVEIYPVINKTKEEYLTGGRALLAKGAKKYGGKPFRVFTGQGSTLTVLAPEFCHDVKNDNRLSSTEFLLAYWQAGTPGFEPYFSSGSELIREMIRTHLTQSDVGRVAKLSQPLADEAANALKDVFTDNEEWHEITLAPTIAQIVARVSALVFLGPELCRDPTWLTITINYPQKAMAAAKVLRSYPAPVRRFVHWFLPCCRELRQMLRTARQAIEPILQKRREQEAEKGGVVFDNALAWIEKLAKKQQDRTAQNAAFQQLGLSILANASSTDMVSQNLLDLCVNPEVTEALRGEIVRETRGGWKSSTLYNLRLLDSVLKETLRLKPIASGQLLSSTTHCVIANLQIVALGRRVMEDGVKLSDGTVLPKTTGVAVSSANMWDPEIYPNPETFDGRRFLRMREGGNNEHNAQLASVSPEHMGFGLGSHACPGRFFGASSAKLIMSHILLGYEFKLADDVDKSSVEPMRFGFSTLANPRAKVLIRRRKDVV
ncbi:cytochrome P450 [Colletotrichum tamarilloi]|uniref:Cytochrome P450 n=1 Tax=Colletotrichum tamarilloi TaxID=1209934 RepID=A0ABQ9QM31_9PEZI|nr:cytochrome P450 [Colletotrichum tamarilloi]KAK1477424.1 cytochrome P450 [Colletotrichum tamarilloi]